jgi:hypothetical protein
LEFPLYPKTRRRSRRRGEYEREVKNGEGIFATMSHQQISSASCTSQGLQDQFSKKSMARPNHKIFCQKKKEKQTK